MSQIIACVLTSTVRIVGYVPDNGFVLQGHPSNQDIMSQGVQNRGLSSLVNVATFYIVLPNLVTIKPVRLNS